MNNRLKAAWLVWRTRPLVLAFAGLCLLMLLASTINALTSNKSRECDPEIRFSAVAFREYDELDALQSSDRLNEVRELEMRWLWNDYERFQMSKKMKQLRGNEQQASANTKEKQAVREEVRAVELLSRRPALWELLGQCSQLRKLSFGFMDLNEDALKNIGELRQVEELSLAHTPLRGEQLRHLKSLHNLKFLDLSGCRVEGGLHHLASLASLPKLETLVLNLAGTFTDSDIEDLRKLTHLKVLSVQAVYVPGSVDGVTDRGLSTLVSHPSLKTLYINDFPSGGAFRAVQNMNPGFKVRRTTYSATMVQVCGMLLFMQVFVLLMLIFQLPACLMNSSAAMLPDPSRWHLMIVGGVSAVTVCVCSLILSIAGADVLGAFSVSFAGNAYLLLLGFWASPMATFQGTSIKSVCAGLSFGVVYVVVFLLGNKIGPYLDPWLKGDTPFGAIGVLLIGFLLYAWAFRLLGRVPREAHANNVPPVGGISDLAQVMGTRAIQRQQAGRGSKPGRYMAEADRRLEKSLARMKSGAGETVYRKLLQAGNPGSTRWVLMICLLAPVFWFASQTGMQFLKGLPLQKLFSGRYPSMMLGPSAVFLIIIPIGASVLAWRNRMPMIGYELLRPVSRGQLRKWLFFSVLFESSIGFCIALPVIAAVLYFQQIDMEPALVSSLCLLAIAAVVMILGVVMWVILVQRNWVAVAIGGGGALFCQIAMILMAFAGKDVDDVYIIGMLILAGAGVVFTIGVAALVSAWRYWERMEFG